MRRRTSLHRLSVLLIVAVSVGMSGCMPQVLHGPHIEKGTSGLINLGVGRQYRFCPECDDDDAGLLNLPYLNLGLRQGFTGQDGETAVALGLQSSAIGLIVAGDEAEIIGATSFVDVYVQPKRYEAARSDFGAGLMASTVIAAPYVQYGRTHDDGTSWHTTQGLMTSFRRDDDGGFANMAMWITGISWRDRSETGRTAVIFSADGLVGKLDGQNEFLFTLSVTAELGLPRIK